ncbi:MAG: hypothetical protein GY754_32425 [bacterium]|nr:hypothetical protein [bacterium]
MERILIIGSCGAGKSTIALRLQKIVPIEIYHLDRYFWNPGWVPTEDSEWETKVKHIIDNNDTFIIDGNYYNTLEMRIARADTIIFLDIPRWICVFRVLKRILFSKIGILKRDDMAAGCRERFDLEFLKYVWDFNENFRSRNYELLPVNKEIQIHILKNNKDISLFFNNIV